MGRFQTHWHYLREFNQAAGLNFRLLPIIEEGDARMLQKLLSGQFLDQRNPAILGRLNLGKGARSFERGLDFYSQGNR